MPSEFAPPWGKPRVTKQQIKEMQEQYKKAEALAQDTKALEAREKENLDTVFEEEFDAVFESTQKVGIYVWRFQPLHLGHERVLETMISENDKVIVFIGTGWDEQNNPFSFHDVRDFFTKFISWDCIVEEIADTESDKVWVENLWNTINAHTILNTSLTFYGWDIERDYAIQAIQKYIAQYYSGEIMYTELSREAFFFWEVWKQVAISGTLCRELIIEKEWERLRLFVSPSVFYSITKKYES